MQHVDVIVIGAGAAGLMCALTAGQRGRRVLVLDHANKVGKKILMSGGGRCNFTNMYSTPANFLSRNPHFCKSALSRYTPWDFIALVESHGIPYHEKKLGQLFCDNKSRDIVQLLLDECAAAGVEIRTHTSISAVEYRDRFEVSAAGQGWRAESLVVASGGLSIPKMGASGFGYELARQFGLKVLPTRAGLVPFTLDERKLRDLANLAGISVDVQASAGEGHFRENLLFTHRGLSGPAVLQVSSYWQPGEPVSFDLFPERDLSAWLKQLRRERPRIQLKPLLAEAFSRRMAELWCDRYLGNPILADLSNQAIEGIVSQCQPWRITPSGTEGYRTAEVTLGGVDTDELSSQTMEARRVKGLYFIGEVVDVTGHLGGHNFQWAWASGRAAGEVV
ncbi:BaiN/RdsA family NAD(P)/FAD-dependent oxidoreductase [Natronospira bacteriovora]|uniref:NAD(P)/FAD-dependent oxidoreductase n=1 Tax=Natronospira bacteriovora TaxID=3069753 RepID=A0ABU0W4I7_9GAMM|nr:NAD(P)/FAD-dependent oxidoreductase [Natronospira sp. AB-CW4]MDQ2068911.1 NAD(P)/FAD-dependent oxidoreductase [Natronospira sp. AB-CW4]